MFYCPLNIVSYAAVEAMRDPNNGCVKDFLIQGVRSIQVPVRVPCFVLFCFVLIKSTLFSGCVFFLILYLFVVFCS